MPGGGGGLGCLQGELCMEPCKGLLQQVSLTFQSVLEAVLVHWKRNGELLVGNWARTACWQLWVLCLRGHCPSLWLLWESELGKHGLSSPHPVGSQTVLQAFSSPRAVSLCQCPHGD